MTINSAVRLTAGLIILISLALGTNFDNNWLILTSFIGLNLIISGVTRWCPAAGIFASLGLKAEGCSSVTGMTDHQGVHIIAGILTLSSVLSVFFNVAPYNTLIIPLIIGISLAQSAFSLWCPAYSIARLLGCKRVNINN